MTSSRKGRPPKPTILKLLDSEKNKDRINTKEPKPPPAIGHKPPVHLSPAAKKEWKRISPVLEKLGLLTSIDDAALAAYCDAYGRWVQASKELKNLKYPLTTTTPNLVEIVHPLISIINRSIDQMHRYLIEFGMTPSARSRIKVEFGASKAEDDPLGLGISKAQ